MHTTFQTLPTARYPHIVDGAIAASAPIWNFYGEVRSSLDMAQRMHQRQLAFEGFEWF